MRKNLPTSLLVAATSGVILLVFVFLWTAQRPALKIQNTTASSPSKGESSPAAATAYSSGNGFDAPENSTNPNPTLITLKTPATILVGGQAETVEADPIGLYPRLQVPPKARIPIHLRVNPNELVREEVLDGGKLDDKSQIKFQYSDSSGNLDFDYLIREQPGNYRVAVYRQGLRQILNFWVGPELPQRVPVSTE